MPTRSPRRTATLLSLSALALAPFALATPSELPGPGGEGALEAGWTRGALAVESLGALAFGPEGVLFAADHEGAQVVALKLDVDAASEDADATRFDVENVDEVVSYLLGTTRADVRINDLAVTPAGGAAVLSVTRGGGDDAQHALVVVRGPEDFEVVDLSEVDHQRVDLDDAPEPDDGGRRSRRTQTITDLVFHDGTLYVAGLSNEEFASRLRALEWPFAADAKPRGTSVEIYHGAHGAWETRAPVRAMVAMQLAGEDTLMAGYTCTPLVRIPVEKLEGVEKFVGTTVAELGNRNTPLDMVVYEREGAGYLLIANSARGVMKLATAGLESAEGITDPVEETGGHPYETIDALEGIAQLAPLSATHALAVVQGDGDAAHLRAVALP